MNQSFDLHEYRLRRLAQELTYPATPDIARAIHLKLDEAPNVSTRRNPGLARWRTALVAAILMLVIVVGLLAVPGVRAAVIEFLQVGVIRILLPGPIPTPTPTLVPTPVSISTPAQLQPSPTPRDLIALEDLLGETTLEEAIRKASFTLQLPTFPNQSGQPERVFLQDLGGAMVILVWTETGNPEKARLVLYEIAPGSWAGEKGAPYSLERTQVNRQEAAWAEGPYELYLSDGNLDLRRLIAGHVLIWEENGITYRLESTLSLDQAKEIAESLQPIP